MTTAIQRATNGDLAAALPNRSGRAMIVADALNEESAQRKLLGDYIRHHMVEGVDYGVIPGTKNKTLLKPGAEKLTQLFRCIPRWVIEEKIENWDTGLFYYRFSCRIVTQAEDAVVAEGVGSCSTFESRYRYRSGGRKCPACGAEAIQRSKYPPRDEPDAAPGWYCFAKKGGCGAQFDADDPEIVEQKTGRVQNPDILDTVNSVLKIAKKRALVDASIALARCSDIFTQDLEDSLPQSGDENPIEDPAPRRRVESKPAEAAPSEAVIAAGRAILAGAKSVADLASLWLAIPPAVQKHLEADKNRRKAELSAAAEARPAPAKDGPGAAFLASLDARDADLAGRKLCVPGQLKAHVLAAGSKRGLSPDVTAWNADAVKLGEAAADDFEEAAGDQLRHELGAELKRTGKAWGKAMMRLNTLFPDDAGYSEATKYAEIPRDRVEALVKDLRAAAGA